MGWVVEAPETLHCQAATGLFQSAVCLRLPLETEAPFVTLNSEDCSIPFSVALCVMLRHPEAEVCSVAAEDGAAVPAASVAIKRLR